MQIELRRLHQRLGTTTIAVTHDQREALTMSDRVVVMNHGRIMQVGTPREVYERPANLFVASFIGESFSSRVDARDGARSASADDVACARRRRGASAPAAAAAGETAVVSGQCADGTTCCDGRVRDVVFQGESVVHLLVDGIEGRAGSRRAPAPPPRSRKACLGANAREVVLASTPTHDRRRVFSAGHDMSGIALNAPLLRARRPARTARCCRSAPRRWRWARSSCSFRSAG